MISRQHNCLEFLEMAQCCYNLHKRSSIGLCPLIRGGNKATTSHAFGCIVRM